MRTAWFACVAMVVLAGGIAWGATPPATQAEPSSVVRQVQERLQLRRHYEVGPVDGIFDSDTHIALWHYQQDKNLRLTGQMDRETLASLGLGAAAREAPPAMQFPEVAQLWGEPQAGGGYHGTALSTQ
jgi:hypothetical protein